MLRFLRTNTFTIIFAAVAMVVFSGYVFGADGEFSETENRYLAKRPEITLPGLSDGSFMKSFELYTGEQLPFRNEFIKLKAVCGELLFKNENNGIARGAQGYLFEKLLCTEKQLEKNKAAICGFAGQTDRDIYVCIVPNSCEILKDDLPCGFPNISQSDQIKGFYDMTGEYANVHTVDMSETLANHADKYIFYRTDHHWTTEGAYYGYCKLCEDMGLDAVDINSEEMKDKLRTVDDFYGTYHSRYRGMFGGSADTISYYDIPVASYEAGNTKHDSLYDLKKADTYDKYAMFMHGNDGLGIVKALPDESGKRRDELIIFKDSYSNCLIPFLTYDYDSISVIDLRYFPGSVKKLIDEHEDTDILLIYNFMHFNEDNHFYRLTS